MLINILIPVLLILIVMSLLKCPIYVSILLSAIYLQIFVNHMSISNLFTGVFESMTKSALMAVPFFMVAGSIIAASSLGKRLINVFIELLKAVRGGFPIACVVANGIFGAISGSGPAATAVFGKICYEPLKERHGEKLSLGVIVSSASLSTIIPPSVSMIIFGVATETSITKLFLAGLIPGILIVAVVAVYLVIRCKPKKDAPKVSFSWKEFRHALWKGLPVLVLPVIVLGSVYSGICTPTESGALSALYAFVVAVFFLRDIKIRQLPTVFKDAARTTAQVFLLIATSTVFSQAATVAQLPQLLQEAFAGMGYVQFLLMLNIVLLIVGCFFDTGAAILILAPMLMPTALALGINPLHLGIVFISNLAIGLFTPPFGLNIFVAQSVLKRPMGIISKSVLPYIALYFGSVLLITYVPILSTWLPG
ncbi:MAG: TRAP transporter large permease [Parasporobacterium sp.]|nr:TRAP transporter large permease [Parasporobacterium sp.]